MRKFLFVCLACCFSTGYAQSFLPAIGRPLVEQVFSKAMVEGLSRQSYNTFWTNLGKIPSFIAPVTTQMADITPAAIPTFQMQISSDALDWYTASGFAMEIQGEVIGFTAGHVGKNILEDPFIKVKAPDGTFVTAPIEKMLITDRKGLDIAAFKVPDKVKDFVTVLKPSRKLWEAGSPVQITGFNRGSATQLPQENILFSSPQRYLVQHSHPRERTGMCGSPLQDPATGEVVGMYIGYEHLNDLRQKAWFYFMPNEVQRNFTDLHFAVPIQRIKSVAEAFVSGNKELGAVEMKVLGRPIGFLYPEESILSVTLMRNGYVLEKVNNNVFLNPEKLEEFFELKENDVLRIMVSRPQKTGTPTPEIMYDVNVSTGEVTRTENYPRRVF